MRCGAGAAGKAERPRLQAAAKPPSPAPENPAPPAPPPAVAQPEEATRERSVRLAPQLFGSAIRWEERGRGRRAVLGLGCWSWARGSAGPAAGRGRRGGSPAGLRRGAAPPGAARHGRAGAVLLWRRRGVGLRLRPASRLTFLVDVGAEYFSAPTGYRPLALTTSAGLGFDSALGEDCYRDCSHAPPPPAGGPAAALSPRRASPVRACSGRHHLLGDVSGRRGNAPSPASPSRRSTATWWPWGPPPRRTFLRARGQGRSRPAMASCRFYRHWRPCGRPHPGRFRRRWRFLGRDRTVGLHLRRRIDRHEQLPRVQPAPEHLRGRRGRLPGRFDSSGNPVWFIYLGSTGDGFRHQGRRVRHGCLCHRLHLLGRHVPGRWRLGPGRNRRVRGEGGHLRQRASHRLACAHLGRRGRILEALAVDATATPW